VSWVDWDAMWRVLVLGVAFGVGVVGLFSLAIVGLGEDETGVGRLRGRLLAALCLAACVAAVGLGIWVMLDKG
jgi:hypothetical protein